MGRAFLGFLTAVALIIPVATSSVVQAQQGGPPVVQGPERGFANNDCRGDLESSLHTGDGRTGDNGGGNNNDRGRQFDDTVVAGSPNNPHVVFGNNNGKCVSL